MEHEGSLERRERIRQRMKEFYGDPNTSTRRAEDLPKRSPAVAPEMDLDSEYFNVSRYTTDLLRRESLKGLVESDTALLRSVRRLDGELQELVYRNYAKFISATDTIREMRDNVAEMDTKLLALSSNVDNIDALSHKVDEQLRAHRSRIEETISTNRMLKKVQFLQGLPGTMRRLIEKHEYNTCVKYWVAGDGFLARHTAIPAIARIQQQCRALARELYGVIESTMCAIPLDDPDAMEVLRGYVEDLRLLRATSLFQDTTTASSSSSSPPPAGEAGGEDGHDFEQTVLAALMRSVTANFQAGVDAAQRGWRAALATPDAAALAALSLSQRQALLAQMTLREALAQLKSACALLAVNSERVYVLLNQVESGAEAAVGLRIGQEIQPVLIDLLTPLPLLMRDLAIAVLRSMLSEGRVLLRQPDVLQAALRTAVLGFVQQLKHLSVTLRTLGDNYLDTALNQQSKAYASLVDQALVSVLQGCVAFCEAQLDECPTEEVLAGIEGHPATALLPAVQHAQSHDGTAGEAPNEASAAETSVRVGGNYDSRLTELSAEAQRQEREVMFALTRRATATLALLLAEDVQSVLATAEVMPGERLGPVCGRLVELARALHGRTVMLLGQVAVNVVWPAGFAGIASVKLEGTSEATSGTAAPRVPAVLPELLRQWHHVSRVLYALPELSLSRAGGVGSPASTATSGAAGSTPGVAVHPDAMAHLAPYSTQVPYTPAGSRLRASQQQSPTQQQQQQQRGGLSILPSTTPTAPRNADLFSQDRSSVYNSFLYAGAGGGGGGANERLGGTSSIGRSSSDRRASTLAGSRGRGRGLVVSYTRPEQATLQSNVHGIFFVEDFVLHTMPADGKAASTMRGVVIYLCKALVDRVRREAMYDGASFQRVQLSCTFLLRALLSPAKGTAPRRWLKEWDQSTLRTIQRLLDDCCISAYDRYEEKVPLPNTTLDKIVEEALSDRAASAGRNAESNAANERSSAAVAVAETAPAVPSEPQDKVDKEGGGKKKEEAAARPVESSAAATQPQPQQQPASSSSASSAVRSTRQSDSVTRAAQRAAVPTVPSNEQRVVMPQDEEELPL